MTYSECLFQLGLFPFLVLALSLSNPIFTDDSLLSMPQIVLTYCLVMG